MRSLVEKRMQTRVQELELECRELYERMITSTEWQLCLGMDSDWTQGVSLEDATSWMGYLHQQQQPRSPLDAMQYWRLVIHRQDMEDIGKWSFTYSS